ncbi:C40 family peptidase [Armatimonas sp.]|uniref:C40 family peptidase n=1 Tax=Armatimonas sp. TaxID=1872638 RepID=UPI00286BA7AA|nr:C40 family peptidase [Armatimonas sp.]
MKIITGVLPLVALLAPAAWAQGGSLDVTVNTGATSSSAATRGVAAPSFTVAKAPQTKSLPPIPKKATPSRGNLSSRSGRPQDQPQSAPTSVTVRPAKVAVDSLAIRSTRIVSGKILSTATRGQTLAVISEMDDLYGVLMVNNTIGWVPKEAMELLDYNTEITLASTPSEPKTTTSSGLADRSGLTERQRQVLREAFSYMGVPYVWAGNTRSGLDCSAFTKNVYSTIGVDLPRHSGHQIQVGRTITDTGNLIAGDRLYFAMKGGSTITHTGIYIGEGFFIHASSNHKCVDVDPLFKSYVNKLVAIRRD